jgi:hypothetical protein
MYYLLILIEKAFLLNHPGNFIAAGWAQLVRINKMLFGSQDDAVFLPAPLAYSFQ